MSRGDKAATTLILSASSRKLADEPTAVDIFALEGATSSPAKPVTPRITGITRWFLGGWREKTIRALSPRTGKYLLQQFIAFCFQAIITNIHFRLTCRSVDPFSSKEIESYRAAYLALKLLPKSNGNREVSMEAWKLRLDMIRTVIQSNTPLLSHQWHKHTARRLFEELEDLQALCCESESLKEVLAIKSSLTERLALELSEPAILSAPTTGPVMSGIRVVAALCNDLAYGEGSHAVQNALIQVSHEEWGCIELQKLARESPVLVHCIKRLVVDFQNPFAATVAFRLCCRIKTPEIHELLEGPHGIGRLVSTFATLVGTREYNNYRAFGYQTNRSLRSVCIALEAACLAGYIMPLLDSKSFLTNLTTLLDHFNQRDERIKDRIIEEGCDDLDMERDQDALICLIDTLGVHSEAKQAMTEANVYDKLNKFLSHPSRTCMFKSRRPTLLPWW